MRTLIRTANPQIWYFEIGILETVHASMQIDHEKEEKRPLEAF